MYWIATSFMNKQLEELNNRTLLCVNQTSMNVVYIYGVVDKVHRNLMDIDKFLVGWEGDLVEFEKLLLELYHLIDDVYECDFWIKELRFSIFRMGEVKEWKAKMKQRKAILATYITNVGLECDIEVLLKDSFIGGLF
jgi:hypothetical protein